MFRQFSRVVLATNKHISDGARQGMVGYIIEVYEDGMYEVEFSNSATGVTLFTLVLGDQDIAKAPAEGSPEGPDRE